MQILFYPFSEAACVRDLAHSLQEGVQVAVHSRVGALLLQTTPVPISSQSTATSNLLQKHFENFPDESLKIQTKFLSPFNDEKYIKKQPISANFVFYILFA